MKMENVKNTEFSPLFAKDRLQFLAKTRCFSLVSKNNIDKNWLKLGLFYVFVLLLVAKSSKTPSFSLSLRHEENKMLQKHRVLSTFCTAAWSNFGLNPVCFTSFKQ